MSLAATLVILAAALALAAFCIWYERRPRELGEVRLVPTTVLLILAVVLIVASIAHLVTLLTGMPLKGRIGL